MNGWIGRLIHLLSTASPPLSPSIPPPQPTYNGGSLPRGRLFRRFFEGGLSPFFLSPSKSLLSLRSLFVSLPTQHLRLRRRPLGRGGYDVTGGAAPRGASVVSMSLEAGIGVMGTKLGMMTYFEPEGAAVPVTVVGFREGNIVTQVKTTATDGYEAVQLARPPGEGRGHPMRHLQEFRLQSVDGFEPGQRLDLEEIFKEGDLVDVSGTSIGKGFQEAQLQAGTDDPRVEEPPGAGSIGAGTTPGRVYKGKKMPGRMGGTKTKIRKLKIVKIDSDLRVLIIKGAVPGKPGNLLRIAPAKIVGVNIPKN
ncbi:unnamed protein product [Spirodela intermedia]|uniref:Large ribosomal subunit protein uL3c n=1 Tax=Spirodela intermedia TaxID=51605 RepID=A0A7I8J2R4_SPIIN|nr:unnamed protein product [Spirodela intermedia]CAA6663691.1 unnamed protein product [Spirodela intermedia]